MKLFFNYSLLWQYKRTIMDAKIHTNTNTIKYIYVYAHTHLYQLHFARKQDHFCRRTEITYDIYTQILPIFIYNIDSLIAVFNYLLSILLKLDSMEHSSTCTSAFLTQMPVTKQLRFSVDEHLSSSNLQLFLQSALSHQRTQYFKILLRPGEGIV